MLHAEAPFLENNGKTLHLPPETTLQAENQLAASNHLFSYCPSSSSVIVSKSASCTATTMPPAAEFVSAAATAASLFCSFSAACPKPAILLEASACWLIKEENTLRVESEVREMGALEKAHSRSVTNGV
jgi:hypothetical protein